MTLQNKKKKILCRVEHFRFVEIIDSLNRGAESERSLPQLGTQLELFL